MSWFRKKDDVKIPPVASIPPLGGRVEYPGDLLPPSRPYRSSANSYNASRDGPDPYAVKAQARLGRLAPPDNEYIPPSDPYSRPTVIGDPYARSGNNVEADREQLFSGYDPERNPPPRLDSQNGGVPVDGEGGTIQEQEEEDVEGIKQATRFTKTESVNSTRNALRIAREAEETGRNTLLKLGDQSEKISNTERHLDMGKAYANRAEDRTDELKQLNRSIFRPVITFNKDRKRAAEEERIMQRHAQERDERELAMADIRESQNRIGRAATYGVSDELEEDDGEEIGLSGRRRNAQPDVRAAGLKARERFQFEKTESDDELEDELDDNLEEISDVTKRLRALAVAAGEEIDNQNARLDRVSNKTTALDDKVVRGTNKLKRIK